MKLHVYSVFDSKTKVYSQYFMYLTRGECYRSFSDILARNDSQFAKHPGDYTLYEVGVFDTDTALIEFKAFEQLGVLTTLKVSDAA